MLSKPTGPTQLVLVSTLTNITGSVTLSTFDGSVPRKVRVAVMNSAVLINFGNNKAANGTSDILMPMFAVEHFSLENTTTATYTAVIAAVNTAFVSFTPIA